MNAAPSPALRLAFYGDDFTGSTDALEVLAFAGLRCALFLEPPTRQQLAALGGFDAIGVAGDSRGMSPAEMNERLPVVFGALQALDADVVHYKVCSTFDSSPTIGSIGRVLEIALETGATGPIPIVAGTPALQRFCLFGELFARSGTDGKIYRLDRHPIMRAHPVTPMDESDLIRFFGRQTTLPIINFPYTHFESNRDTLDAAFADIFASPATASAVVVDAATPRHLTELGRLIDTRSAAERATKGADAATDEATEGTTECAAEQTPERATSGACKRTNGMFVIGSSGLEYALTQWWADQGLFKQSGAESDTTTSKDMVSNAATRAATRLDPSFDVVKPAASVLTISGSASPLSAVQIDTAVAAGFLEIALDSAALVDETEHGTAINDIVARAVAALSSHAHVIMHTAKGPQDERIEAMLQYFMARGVARAEAKHRGGRLLGERLGDIAERILKACHVGRVVISGGDTSSRITQVLAPDALEIAARLTPGAPLCRLISAKPHLRHLEIALKGGQMGHAAYFVDAANGRR